MELREILNRVESVVINAKSFMAGNNMSEVQKQLLNLKAFLNEQLVNHPAEQPTEQPDEQPASAIEESHARAAAAAEKVAGPEQPTKETAAEREYREGSGVTTKPEQAESKGDAGVVSKPEKSQNRDGSGVS